MNLQDPTLLKAASALLNKEAFGAPAWQMNPDPDYEDAVPTPGVLPHLKRNAGTYAGLLTALGTTSAAAYGSNSPIPFMLTPHLMSVLGLTGATVDGLRNAHAQRNLTKATQKEAEEKKPIGTAPDAPTLEQLMKAYPHLSKLLKYKAEDARSVEKPDIVKDVEYASSYGDVARAGKKQGIGLLTRHLLAAASRPTVWGSSNAFFVPRGEKGFVVGNDRLNPDVVKHEYGHAEDYARLGGEKGFKKEYQPGFLERLKMTPREAYLRSVLLPEARAWHYAGKPVELQEPDIRNRAFHTYVNHGEMFPH